MSKLIVHAIKLSKNPKEVRVAYEKDGYMYMRTGDDNFTKGTKLHIPVTALMANWGFSRVDKTPAFDDGRHLEQNIHRFERTNGGKVNYID